MWARGQRFVPNSQKISGLWATSTVRNSQKHSGSGTVYRYYIIFVHGVSHTGYFPPIFLAFHPILPE